MFTFKRIDFDSIDKKNKAFSNATEIFTTYEWLKFLKKGCNVDILILQIFCNGKEVGFFYGGIIKKYGVRIVGSPFNGWNTPYMGFCLNKNVDANDIVVDLWNYLKKEYKIMYFQLCDKKLDYDKLKKKKLRVNLASTYGLNLAEEEDIIFSKFSKHCRKNINFFERKGAYIKELSPKDNFSNDFYNMIIKVFANQKLKPPYTKEKFDILIKSIPKEMSLYIGAFNPSGKCIGYLASYYCEKNCYTLISATDREENYKQKNYLRWYAIKYWKRRRVTHLDMIGMRPYKLEFNPLIESFCVVSFSKFRALFFFKFIASKMYWILNKIKYIIKR